ncbi:MAG: hypothetical protein ACQER9_03305 [Nanobdellota archaeon]
MKKRKNKKISPEIIFYIVGIIFLLFSIVYFSQNYLFMLSDSIKTIILTCIIISTFFIAESFAGRDL